MTTAQRLRIAAKQWRFTHEMIHGQLDAQTAETVNEALSFVITCAQSEDHLRQGEPFQADLEPDHAHPDN